MKIGFSLLTHKKTDEVLVQLMNQLNLYPDKEIVIHHDFSKTPFDVQLLNGVAFDVVKDSYQTAWSHVNNIDALLKTFEILFEKKCEWFISLSANCYPIKKPAEVLKFLSESRYDGYIERNNVYTDFFDFYKYFRESFTTKYLFKIPFISRKGTFYFKTISKKRNPKTIVFTPSYIPYHGSDWFMINRKSMEYLLNNKALISQLTNFLGDVNNRPDLNVCPAEIVFQTILGNNKELNLNNNYFRYIDWTNAVNWHPNVLVSKDFEAIENTDALFARKFDALESMDLITQINNKILK